MTHSNFHRAVWNINPLSFDPETMEVLLGHCPECGNVLGWTRCHGISMCDKCIDDLGRATVDLRDFPQPVIEVNDAEALEFATALVSHHQQIRDDAALRASADWGAIGPDVLFCSVVTIATYLSLDQAILDGTDLRQVSAKTKANGVLAPEALARAGRALMDGTAGVDDLLAECRERLAGTATNRGRSAHLGRITATLKDRRLPDILRQTFRTAIDRHFEALPIHFRRGGGEGYVTLRDAGQSLGINFHLMKAFKKHGLIDIKRSGHRDTECFVHLDTIRKTYPILEDLMTSVSAQSALSISREELRELEAYGLVEGLLDSRLAPVFELETYSRKSIEVLSARLAGIPSGDCGQPVGRILKEAMPRKNTRGAAIAVILSGQIDVFRIGGGLWSENIAVADREAFLCLLHERISSRKRLVDSDEMTTAQVAVALAVTLSTLTGLHNAGFLRRSRKNRYLCNDLEEFLRRYILGGEVRQNHHINGNGLLAAFIAKLGIEREAGLMKHRPLVYDRQTYNTAVSSVSANDLKNFAVPKRVRKRPVLKSQASRIYPGGIDIKDTGWGARIRT